MPFFASEEEYQRCSHDPSLVAEKADAFIGELYSQLETVKAQADAASITAEQTCSLLEQKYVSLSSEFATLQSQYSNLNSTLDQRLSELAKLQSEKHQIHLQSIGKDGEIERLSTEISELHKSKRQLMELLEQKDLEISEKNATIKSYLDKIINLTDSAGSREARLSDIEAELVRSRALCARISQEKELIERHNAWLNDELTSKVDSLSELRKTHGELESEMSTKLTDVEKKFSESCSSLYWYKERVRELELKLASVQEELCSSKDATAVSEERFSAELSTVNKLVELYKESSEEWSKKAGELEGVIKALEKHSSVVENDLNDKVEKEACERKAIEKEAALLKEKLEKCEEELEKLRKANELNPFSLSSFTTKAMVEYVEADNMVEDNHMLVPKIPIGVSGTALAASLLRDGWSLAKMYAKYQEAVDALRHEQLGRKQSQAILERVLYELEEKAGVILDERAEHERMVEAYSSVNQKLQLSLSEQSNVERTVLELKADIRRQERDYNIAQKEISDLQKQVTILLKECRDIQLRCKTSGDNHADEFMISLDIEVNPEYDGERVISERLLTFKDINGLVEQNVQLRSIVRNLSEQIENVEIDLKEKFEKELQKHTDEAASKVDVVLARAEEQACMIESLHTSVAMYKKLYEEEHKHHSTYSHPEDAIPENGKRDLMLLIEGSQESARKAQEQTVGRVKYLEEDLAKLRSEILLVRSERDKLALEANFAQEKLDRYMKEFENQRKECNGVIARNVEFSQLIIDYQRKLRESAESLHTAEDLSRKLTMEVSVLRNEKEILLNAEKRASDEIRALSERVHRLQASLDTVHSTEEVREEARCLERKKQEDYINKIEKEWAESRKELQEEHNNVRTLALERESSVKDAMRQVEEIGKQLNDALRAVGAAEARAAVAEARCLELEKTIKSSIMKVSARNGECEPSASSNNEAIVELDTAREEIEKLREESQVNKDHMLQYKSIAQVNEAALKQMEYAHENFKIEADKIKKSLEDELNSLREHVTELENECSMKTKEVALAVAGQEEVLASSQSEIASLKEENSAKLSEIVAMETQISALKEDLEREHQQWRTAQTNYERQVILQSETIQELTKTSKALGTMQEEVSKSRQTVDKLKTENVELKMKWEADKLMLEETANLAEKKYNEINEQNKILHSHLEALHIRLAEKDRSSATPCGSSDQDAIADSGLQTVVNYLRRSKEIAETEISLLKQEKLRLQSQIESAQKAADTARASLQAERSSSRALLFTEEEFKSLQLQVREMNLLRESNMQLREENRHNFEECQKLREAAQKASVGTDNLKALLGERENEVEACRREIGMQKLEQETLKKKANELLEKFKNIDLEDYDRLKDDVQQMKSNLKEKDDQSEEIRKVLSEKQDVLLQLEKDLATSRTELNEREARINELLLVEASLKSDIEKHRKLMVQFKKRSENISKEKEELIKENQSLAKQLEDSRQGKKSTGDAASEQAVREKEKEKDTRIQILEKTVEKQREELKKEKDEHRAEKAKRLKTHKTLSDSYESVHREKAKLEDDLVKHNQAVKVLMDEVDKIKHAKSSQPEGTSEVQMLSGTILEDLATSYLQAVENFDRVARPVFSDLGASVPDTTSAVDTPALGGQSTQPSSIPSSTGPISAISPAKPLEERENRVTLPKANTETRKMGRRLVRPRIVKPEEPQGDTEMPEVEGASNNGKSLLSHLAESQENPAAQGQSSVRKRPSASPIPELQEESLLPLETSSDMTTPVLKKAKGSESPKGGTDGQFSVCTETPEIPPVFGVSNVDAGDVSEGFQEEAVDAEANEVETSGMQSEELKIDSKTPEVLSDRIDVGDESLNKRSETVSINDQGKVQNDQDEKQLITESISEQEEGELIPDNTDLEGGVGIYHSSRSPEIMEVQLVDAAVSVSSSGIDDDVLTPAAMDTGEIHPPLVPDDEKNNEGEMSEQIDEASEKVNDNIDQIASESDRVTETATGSNETVQTTSAVEMSVQKQGSPSGSTDVEVKQASPIGRSSTTINLHERARQRAMLRQAGVISSSVTRGRGRAPRGRGGRNARGGHGQPSGDQG